MSILNIVLHPDDPLLQTAEAVSTFDAPLERLVQDMFETMYTYEGVGLAAPQIGLSKRIFVLDEPDGQRMALINPEIVASDGSEIGSEGCLSLPEIYLDVPRFTHLEVHAQDVKGQPLRFEAQGFLARIIQHELDHLDGTLIFDRVDILTRQAKLHEWEEIRARLLSPPVST